VGGMVDLTGQRFGRLTVLRFAGIDKHRNALWLCRCDCGEERVVIGANLRSGHTTSCKCLQQERAAQRMRAVGVLNFKHGHATTPEYRSRSAMIQRCYDPNAQRYPRYGGRGIRVCDRWLGERGFENFLADVGPRPKGTTLGRFGDEGNYAPGNVKWMTRAEQEAEKRQKRNLKLAA
jgi:hypothetical protein